MLIIIQVDISSDSEDSDIVDWELGRVGADGVWEHLDSKAERIARRNPMNVVETVFEDYESDSDPSVILLSESE